MNAQNWFIRKLPNMPGVYWYNVGLWQFLVMVSVGVRELGLG